MANWTDYRRLLRMEQWPKNLFVLIPFFFFESARSGVDLALALVGFCLISSVTYIINDWVDRAEDRLHPTKKERPLASGRITGRRAEAVSVLLLMGVGLIAWHLGVFYALVVGTYFVATNLYSFGLKHLPFLDIVMIAANFELRMLGGMTQMPAAHEWGPFLFVFMLMFMFLSHKRRADIRLLGREKAVAHKPVLKYYRRPVVYGLRGLSYIGMGLALVWMELPWLTIAALLFALLVTSYEFVNQPVLVLKPHRLVMRPRWIAAVLLLVATLLFT